MHIVDDVHRVDVQMRYPCDVGVHSLHDLVIVKLVYLHRLHLRSYLHAAGGVVTAVDSDEQKLSEVATSTEELHLFTNLHSGNAASDSIVVSVDGAHEIVVFVLDGVCIDRNLSAEFLESLGKLV